MAMLLLLLSLPMLVIIFLLTMKKLRRSPRRPPGPKGLPLIGNIHQVDISKPHIWLTNLSKKHGPLIYLKLCRMPLVVISSADAAKKALKQNDVAFAGRPSTYATWRFTYDHSDIISASYADYWREMRKTVVHHLFSPHKLRSHRHIRDEEASRMIDEISRRADLNEAVDVGETVWSFNCNVLCRVAFGKRLDSWKRLEELKSQFLASMVETFLADCVVFGWINKLLGAAKRVDKVFEEMDSFYQQLIDEHLSPDRPDSMNNDIIDLLIQLQQDHSAEVKIDWKHIKGILMNIFVAGTDTAGMSLHWAMTALTKNPNVMKKAQEEIRSVVMMSKKRSIDEDDIEKLPYLKAVVKEALRLYPPVPLIPRETIKSCIIDGYEIQEKTLVLVNAWAIGRDPGYWENADEFMPERFLNASIDYKGQEFGFIPFGSGRRICVGTSLAVATMEVALANLLYSFNWEIPNGKTKEDIDTDASIGLVLHKKTPLYLQPKSYVSPISIP